MTFVGVDPGLSGGIADIAPCGEVISLTPMPSDIGKLWRLVYSMRGEDVYACIEQVTGYVGDGGNPGSAMFAFGTNNGMLRMAMTAAGIPFIEVTPRVWQKALGIHPRSRGQSKTVWKNQLKGEAQILFPNTKLTLKTCDALLIAEYCRRFHAPPVRIGG